MTVHLPARQVSPDLTVVEAPLVGHSGLAGAGQHLFSLFRRELLAFAEQRGAVQQQAQAKGGKQ